MHQPLRGLGLVYGFLRTEGYLTARGSGIQRFAFPFRFPFLFMKTTTKPETVGSRELAAMVNLTERRLRQLSQEKRIPAPVRGQWPMPDTIQKLFHYYQSSSEEYAREKVLKLSAQRKRQEVALAREEGKSVLKSDVAQAITRIIGPARHQLESKLIGEYPTVVAGLEPAAVRVYSRRVVDQFLEAMQALGAEFDKL